MLIARNKLLPRIIATEKDPSGLGRWINQLVEGKGDHKARYLSAYVPCKDQGKFTVYSQHHSHFQKLASEESTGAADREPLQAWMEDLPRKSSFGVMQERRSSFIWMPTQM